MVFLREEISKIVEKAVYEKFPQWSGEIKIEYPSDSVNGDYSTNIALQLAKFTKRPPREIAQEIISNIKKPDWILKISIAGAGFINFYISSKFLTEFAERIIKAGEKYGKSEIKKGKVAATDISHPNVAKPMGAHHLLSTIIGNVLNRILAAVGYRVIRDNYIGDWGTQFGKLIYAYKTWGDEAIVKKNPIQELLKLYVKFHDEVEKKQELEDFGRLEFKKLENGDKENRKLWQWIVDLSMQEFQKIYDRLGIDFDFIRGESFYEDKMQEIIDLGIKKGVFVKGEGGALIAPFKHEKYPPCLIKKSDGATLYATRDLARTKYWEDSWHPDLMIMVADTAQNLHFKQFFEVAQMLGITDAENIHVAFGRMRFPEKRMSTRKGNIILMEELLDEAEEAAYKIVCEKNPELAENRKREVARQVGIGAVKYAILSQNRLTDITFTWDKMLSLEGNSAPYLQYVYARGRSIIRKMPDARCQMSDVSKYIFKEPQELAVTRLLPRFPEVIVLAAEEFKPNLIANYLFELASVFNSFYASVPVLQAEESVRAGRLKLVEAITIVLKNGLELFGIAAPEEM
ncbi:arginine--tRNA ligase [Candidatus Peregrinibacteria bacterium]|nr:arginine--tRNA ligase [Candidatus Peregrinibacteria bacterium]